jgi:hypothetical protein
MPNHAAAQMCRRAYRVSGRQPGSWDSLTGKFRAARDTPAIVKKSNRVSNFLQSDFWLVCVNLSRILRISGALSEGDLPAERRTRNFES